MPEILLEIRDLRIKIGERSLVSGLNLSLARGASLGILGESGSGKSLSCKAVIGFLPDYFKVSGSIRFLGQNLLNLTRKQLRRFRGRRIGYIMQNPMGAFDPLMSVGAQMAETYKTHYELSYGEARAKAAAILEKMLIRNPERVLGQYPHELSGGMLQRAMIALTLSLEPELVIADEPTTALDVITQAEIIQSFVKLKNEMKSSIIFVSHDLGVIAKTADDILVMNGGSPVEYGAMEEVFAKPQSSHTRYLFDSRLRMMKRFHQQLEGWADHAAQRQ